MATATGRRPALRTKASCVTCRTRRKKCDLARPACHECTRLKLHCEWLPDDQTSIAKAVRDGLIVRKNKVVQLVESRGMRMDQSSENCFQLKYGELAAHDFSIDIELPWLLKASPTSVLDSDEEKQLYQYLKEKGHGHIRLPLAKVPVLEHLNVFVIAFQVAVRNPGLLYAHLAFAAAQLSQHNQHFAKYIPVFYSKAIQYIKAQMDLEQDNFPSEAVCGIAGVLSVLEMCTFADGEARVAHLLGYHHLMQLKLQYSRHEFSPVKILPEMYSHMLATSSTFYPEELIGSKSYYYFDSLMAFMNSTPRPLGPEICGIPAFLLTACWRLAYLRSGRTEGTERDQKHRELLDSVAVWQPEARLLEPINENKLIVSQLYHGACKIYAHKIANPDINDNAPTISSTIQDVAKLLRLHSDMLSTPALPLAWPMIIFCLACHHRSDFDLFQAPLRALIDHCGFKAFISAVKFTDQAWGSGPESNNHMGLDALHRDDLLRQVHI